MNKNLAFRSLIQNLALDFSHHDDEPIKSDDQLDCISEESKIEDSVVKPALGLKDKMS